MVLKELKNKLASGWYNLFFTDATTYPEEIPQAMRDIISEYIRFNFKNLIVDTSKYDDEPTLLEVHDIVYNAIKMNEFNIKTKAKLLTAEYKPASNYEKFSEIKNAYDTVVKNLDYDIDKTTSNFGQDKNTTVIGQDKSTSQNGATSDTSTTSTSAYDSDSWSNADKVENSTNAYTDIVTRDARTDSNTRDARVDTITKDAKTDTITEEAREDVITEHTYGNIGTMRIDEILMGVWALGDMEFVKFVADIVVNSVCTYIFDMEV